ncbi:MULTISPECIES: SDR family NAD(P)-dependent oxidoreductase [unclassified Spirillospora]|uniref:SDR family NAD(P)-dependent oxidoreductase n=1 Tax=unclassified Spirillospora TaxID=2642701 RepID=UPI003716C454
MSLASRSAIVTGGGSGIGASLTAALVGAGADVVCTDRDLGAAEKTAAGLAGPRSARAAAVDVTQAAQVQQVVDEVVEAHGRIDLMFNNAGITYFGDTEHLTLDLSRSIIEFRALTRAYAAW